MKLRYKKYLMTSASIWAGCFVLLLLVHLFVVAPQKQGKKKAEQQFDEKKQMYDSALNALQEEAKIRLREQFENLQSSLEEFVTDSDDSADLTLDIGQIANEKKLISFGIKGNNKREGSAVSKGQYLQEKKIDITFKADFNTFAAFLNALERHRPVIFVDKFIINRSKKGDSNHQVNMNLAVLVKKRQDN